MLATVKGSTISPTVGRPARTVDDALLASIAHGDKHAMEHLFTRHNPAVYRFVYRLTGNAALAEEIVSEVFLAVWRNAASFQAKSSVSTWLLAIARNKTIAALRHQREAHLDDDRVAGIADLADSPETNSHLTSRSAVMQRCLAQLSPAHREIVDLVYYHEKSVAEAALIVGIPEGTVKTRMLAARRSLADLLKQAGVHRFAEC